MATRGNLDTLAAGGLPARRAGRLGRNDLFVAVRADSTDAAKAAVEAGEAAMFAERAAAPGGDGRAPGAHPGGGIGARARGVGRGDLGAGRLRDPGGAQGAVGGPDVLLFSDNVPVEAEVELKTAGEPAGRLVMGPGAGTAMLGGTGLGFANAVRPGRVGVVAAAGTGAQEAASLLDRWGGGVSQVIGLGGRDLARGRRADGGIAVRALVAGPGTEVILLVSKPPVTRGGPRGARRGGGKPLVAALSGSGRRHGRRPACTAPHPRGRRAAAVRALGGRVPDPAAGLVEAAGAALAGLAVRRTLVRGLFSGGTLCYESLVLLGELLGPVYSNTPLDPAHALPAPSGTHQCLDLGEEEYTRGRPHPMIDPAARIELLRAHAAEPDVAAVLLDVVLGHGAHPDPSGSWPRSAGRSPRPAAPDWWCTCWAPSTIRRASPGNGGPSPTPAAWSPETAARASLTAAAIATRDPRLAARPLDAASR